MHIGYYMDVLLRQQHSGLDPVRIVHSLHPQGAQARTISSLASYSPPGAKKERTRVHHQLRLDTECPLPNCHRDAISIAPALDTLFRKTARRVLKLPHDHPTEWSYDPTDGLGLVHCDSQRLYHFLRIANDHGSPTHDLLMESLEAYELDSGLTDHPLAIRIPPPAADCTLLGTMLRDLATFQPALTITTQWHQPAASLPLRPNDNLGTPQPGPEYDPHPINKLHAKKGTEIAVTFWLELRKASAIWYSPTPREARGHHRLVPITGCAVLTGSLLPTNRAQRLMFIPWTDTAWTNPRTHITQKGENNRTIIASTAGRTTDLVGTEPYGAPAPPARNAGLYRLSPPSGHYHLVELRSLMALFTDTGTFTGDWIRSHQDPDDTTDPTLRTKRLLLAEADSLPP
ncbi:hypothetical protein B5M09_011416 [Aphanomyces astaci]|uniref:Uncharacterized protein n=1 Tax=Aphanomyces astaci TaxID=112090 RepID=A0A425CXA4_APHAT|nr:hypothetical protein B5M09_011416 [Aphanomyces astaci]